MALSIPQSWLLIFPGLQSTGGSALIEALPCCTRLAKLDLSDNMFSGCGPALAAALPQLPALVDLNLRDLGLADAGIQPVLAALEAAAPKLQVLSLAANELTSAVAGAVAQAAVAMPLRQLHLEENEFGSTGATTLAKALAHRAKSLELEALELGGNQIGSKVDPHSAAIRRDPEPADTR